MSSHADTIRSALLGEPPIGELTIDEEKALAALDAWEAGYWRDWQDIDIVVEGDLYMDFPNRVRLLSKDQIEIEVHSRGDRLVAVLPFRIEDEDLPFGGAKRFEMTPDDSGTERLVTHWLENRGDETLYCVEAALPLRNRLARLGGPR